MKPSPYLFLQECRPSIHKILQFALLLVLVVTTLSAIFAKAFVSSPFSSPSLSQKVKVSPACWKTCVPVMGAQGKIGSMKRDVTSLFDPKFSYNAGDPPTSNHSGSGSGSSRTRRKTGMVMGCSSYRKSSPTLTLLFASYAQHDSMPHNKYDDGKKDKDEHEPSMPVLPSNVVKYSQVPKQAGKVFTADTIPKGLLKQHSTKDGTWGVIRVFKGELGYVLEEPAHEASHKTSKDDADEKDNGKTFHLTKDCHGIIEPRRLHHVTPLSQDVEFVVEFYRVPGTGPVDEKREGL